MSFKTQADLNREFELSQPYCHLCDRFLIACIGHETTSTRDTVPICPGCDGREDEPALPDCMRPKNHPQEDE